MGLTQIVTMDGSRKPLMMEVPVAPELDGPFLVTSTRSLVWIAKAFPNGTLRTAVREIHRGDLFQALVEKIASLSQEREWGSVQTASEEGVRLVIHHLADYDLLDVEVLFGEGFDPDLIPEDIPRQKVTWLHEGWAIVVPADRSFVGTTFDFGEGSYATLIHNASRGVGVLIP
jgi:hypothetical protein